MPKAWENQSGYKDPTAYAATKAISEEEQCVADLVHVIKIIAKWAGFDIMNRIEFMCRKSGRIYR